MESWISELGMLLQVLFSFLLGAIIGWEREHRGVQAGIRTFGNIAMGACVYGLISLHVQWPGDPTRIASQVAIGVGFIGAGVIFRQESRVGGLTTAATLWCAAAIGLGVAFKLYLISIMTTIIIFIFLSLSRTPIWKKISGKKYYNDKRGE